MKQEVKQAKGYHHYAKQLQLCCCVAYFTCYLGRLNFSAAMAAMIQDGVISAEGAGHISWAFFSVYAISQIINGCLAGKLPPRGFLCVGLVLIAFCNFGMAVASNEILLMLVWAVNGFACAIIWNPMVQILSAYLHAKDASKCIVDLTCVCALSTVSSYLLSTFAISAFGWRLVFGVVPLFLLPATAYVNAGFRTSISGLATQLAAKQTVPSPQESAPQQDASFAQGTALPQRILAKSKTFLRMFFLTNLVFVLLPCFVNGYLKDGITVWVPKMIVDQFAVSPSLAVLLALVVPFISLSGAYGSNMVFKRTKSEIGTSFLFFCAAFVSLGCLIAWGRVNVVLTVVLLGVISSCMAGVNTMLIGFYPMRYAKTKQVSMISGVLNFFVYMGASVCSMVVGAQLQLSGWHVVMFTWMALCAVAIAILLVIHFVIRYV